jgi:hypothetical protein
MTADSMGEPSALDKAAAARKANDLKQRRGVAPCFIAAGLVAIAGALLIGLGTVADALRNNSGSEAELTGGFVLFVAGGMLTLGLVFWLK